MGTGRWESNQNGENRFQVGLSFPGEHRDYLEQVAEHLSVKLTKPRVLYDKYYEAEFSRPGLDIYLPNLYLDDCDLVAVFLCKEYENKDWTGLEWQAVRAMIKKRRNDQIMLFRLDDIDLDSVEGLLGLAGGIDIGDRPAKEMAELILQRLDIPDNAPPETDFRTLIVEKISKELKRAQLSDLQDYLQKINFLPLLSELAQSDMSQCEDAFGTLQSALYNATKDCLHYRPLADNDSVKQDLVSFWEGVFAILGCLTLLPLKDDHPVVQDLKEQANVRFRIRLSAQNMACVQILSAHINEEDNHFIQTPNGIAGLRALPSVSKVGPQVVDNVIAIKRVIWKQVYKETAPAEWDTADDEQLNTRLQVMKEQKRSPYYPVHLNDNRNLLNDPEVYPALINSLSNLRAVFYGAEGDALFYLEEGYLSDMIKTFFELYEQPNE